MAYGKVARGAVLPSRLLIGGMAITVEQPVVPMADAGCMGRAHPADLLIEIRGDMLPDAQRRTLMHEIVHMLVVDSGLGETYQDEKFIEPLSHVLFRFLRENDMAWVLPDTPQEDTAPQKRKRKQRTKRRED